MSDSHVAGDDGPLRSSVRGGDPFPETRWSVVRRAGTAHEGRARRALDELCRAYWPALYVMARGRGLGVEDAEDAVQELFASRIVGGSLLSSASPERGRFRVLVKTALERMLVDDWRRATAQKRDARRVVSLESEEGESLYRALASCGLSPDELADRAWSEQLVGNCLARVRAAYRPEEVEIFEQVYWAKAGEPDWKGVAGRLGILVASLQTQVQRVLKSFREAVEAEVRETAESAEAFEEERRWLFRTIGGAL